MSFEEQIKQWVSLDNQLKTLSDRTKQLRDERNKSEETILKYVETSQLKNTTINISGGRLRFVSAKQTAPLTLKYVEECLGKCINNPTHITNIMNVIKNSRETKVSTDIKRYVNA